jgi:hypothetical protein
MFIKTFSLRLNDSKFGLKNKFPFFLNSHASTEKVRVTYIVKELQEMYFGCVSLRPEIDSYSIYEANGQTTLILQVWYVLQVYDSF